MLILSRKQNQTLRIGQIVLTVRKLSGNRVTIAIDAPREVRIVRWELEGKGR